MNAAARLFVSLACLLAADVVGQEGRSEMIPTTVFENGAAVQLEVVVHRPPGTGPFPTVVFNHGSTSNGGDPSLAKFTWTSASVARFFTSRGWLVLFPQRRGRGRSGGVYDEGHNPSRTGYSCEPARALVGVERAIVDVDQVVIYLFQHPDVDARHLLIGGHSRGGAVSFAYVGRYPGIFAGVVNFMGGWMGDRFCTQTADTINPQMFVRAGALAGPTLWLYGENDSYFTLPHSRRNHAAFLAAGGRGPFHVLPTPPGQNGHFLFGSPGLWEPPFAAFVNDIPGPFPVVTAAAGTAAAAPGGAITLSVTSAGAPETYRWFHDGTPVGPPQPGRLLALTQVRPDDAGLYHATVAEAGASTASTPRIVGVLATEKLHGAGSLVGADIVHPNGNRYDQVLLEGTAVSLVADPGEVARVSFVDLNDDIVQVEFSGAGTLTIALGSAQPAAPPASYNQPDVNYVKGHAGIVIAGADETTHVSVFSIGRANAVNQALFREDVAYDGVADIAFLAIASRNGRFGSVRTANANYFATRGFTGLYAPDVIFDGPVYVGNIAAHDGAVPVLVLGGAEEAGVAGGDLLQPNGRAVQIAGLTRLRFLEGRTSHDRMLPAQTNGARFEHRQFDVTSRLAFE